ncbi:MAG: virulence protein SciE type [Bryobacteraceae bacterium]|nr:virulence protein SciE type [Bryobacteraceae bacterium]MDW8377372.1 type VI secretion system accessory protein TagJ [Bryobacterales bacterium]
MSPRELFQAGKLNEAVQALSVELREHPTDTWRRTFLFELLCFTGDFERARKHLELLARESQNAGMGALLLEALMNSERTRNEVFEKKEFPQAPSPAVPIRGTLNGQRFEDFRDADPRIGPRLEIYSAGAYLWIPLQHVERIEAQAPKRLRDQFWARVIVQTGPAFKQAELGECYTPVLYPFTFKHPDDRVRLGRMTVWEVEDGQEIPYGQKMFLVDGEEFPLLEIRTLEFDPPPAQASEEPAAHP